MANEKAEAERLANEKAEAERLANEKAEAEPLSNDKAEAEPLANEKAEAERLSNEKAEAERLVNEKAEAKPLAAPHDATDFWARYRRFVKTQNQVDSKVQFVHFDRELRQALTSGRSLPFEGSFALVPVPALRVSILIGLRLLRSTITLAHWFTAEFCWTQSCSIVL